MLQRAHSKSLDKIVQNGNSAAPHWIEADALRLPFPGQHFNLVTSAFGFRNLADYDAGLREIVRVLQPGGECGILDFSEPKGLIGHLYRILLQTNSAARRHTDFRRPRTLRLSAQLSRTFSRAAGNARHACASAGFREATWTPYTFGIAGLYRGKK